MAKSLFSVAVQTPAQVRNVLAQPNAATGELALCVAIDAALAAAGAGATLQSAAELGGKPIDIGIAAAVSPATDGTPKAVFMIQFQAGSGPGGTNVGQMSVLSNPRADAGVITTAVDLAILAAAAASSATPNTAMLIGNVDIDAT